MRDNITKETSELTAKLVKSKELGEPEKTELASRLIQNTYEAAHLDAITEKLHQKVVNLEQPIRLFLDHANGEISPGRKRILREIVAVLGIDKVLNEHTIDLIRDFSAVSKEIGEGKHLHTRGLNAGALTGLRGVGIIDYEDQLTLVGALQLKLIAKNLKNNPEGETVSKGEETNSANNRESFEMK